MAKTGIRHIAEKSVDTIDPAQKNKNKKSKIRKRKNRKIENAK